jgi:hypothetical protein
MGINISGYTKPHTINREIAVCSGTTQLLKSETVIEYRKDLMAADVDTPVLVLRPVLFLQ